MLTFEKEGHVYRWDGRVVPSVTGIEEAEGITDLSMVPAAKLEASRILGTAVHMACEYDDAGFLDPKSVDPVVAPYLAQWRRFKKNHALVVESSETPYYHKRYWYAGTVDRTGLMMWRKKTRAVILDIKTGVKDKAHGIQLAAYRELVEENGRAQMCLHHITIAVYITPDDYDPVEYNNPSDLNIFLSAANLYRWKQENRHGK